MALRDRTIKFRGTSIKALAKYSSFQEDMPEPKVFKVDIPAGKDLDITDSLGVVGYHDGRHVLKFLVYGNTEADRLRIKRTLTALFHGKRGEYVLSWEPDRKYVGRAEISFEHKFDNADVATVEITREPYSTQIDPTTGDVARERVGINMKTSAASNVTYALTGSSRYSNVWVINKQPINVYNTDIGTLHFDESNSHKIADDFYGYTTLTFAGEDWWLYVDGTNLVVNTAADHFSIDAANGDLVWNGDPSHVTIEFAPASGGSVDISFTDEAKQHVTLVYTRMDL